MASSLHVRGRGSKSHKLHYVKSRCARHARPLERAAIADEQARLIHLMPPLGREDRVFGAASVLAATQSQTAVPLKLDFETRAPKTAENARQNVSVVRLPNPAPQTSGKTREFAPLKGILVRNIKY